MEKQEMLTFIQLPDFETLNALNEYKTLLISLIKEKLVSLSTIGGNTNYLSDSSLKEIGLKNEICSVINSMVVKLPFFNVYTGIIVSSLLPKLWSKHYDLQSTTKFLMEFKIMLDEVLSSLKYKCDYSMNIYTLQCALKNILVKEPAILLSKESLNKLSFEIVKGVLNNVNTDDGLKFGRIHVHVKYGSDYFLMINGVLCEVDDPTTVLIERVKSKLSMSNKMLLFTEDIGDYEESMLIIKILLKYHILLVMCQKKISESLKVLLRRENVVAVERIGLEAAKSIEQATGCVPIYNIYKLKSNVLANAGYYSIFNIKTFNGSNYIIIEKKGCNVSTLYVSCRSFNSMNYTEQVCAQSIKFVYSMIASPFLLPGPINFEEKLICHLKASIVDSEIMSFIISKFCDVLIEIALLYKDLKLMHNNINCIWENGDSYHLKKNAILYSIDGLINSLSIGMIVRNQCQ